MNHRYSFHFDEDGDYVIWEKWVVGKGWAECTRWMIPGTWID